MRRDGWLDGWLGQWRWWQCCVVISTSTWLDQDTCLCCGAVLVLVWPAKDLHSTYLQKQSLHHQNHLAAVYDDDGRVKVSQNWWQLDTSAEIILNTDICWFEWLSIPLFYFYHPIDPRRARWQCSVWWHCTVMMLISTSSPAPTNTITLLISLHTGQWPRDPTYQDTEVIQFPLIQIDISIAFSYHCIIYLNIIIADQSTRQIFWVKKFNIMLYFSTYLFSSMTFSAILTSSLQLHVHDILKVQYHELWGHEGFQLWII